MLRYVLHKMISKKWMILALLIGNILLISITSANAMYGKAVLQRTLTQEMTQFLSEKNTYPGLITIEAGGLTGRNHLALETGYSLQEIPERFGVPASQIVTHYYVGPTMMQTELDEENSFSELISLGSLSDLDQHIELVAGQLYCETPDEDGVVDIMVSERGMVEMELFLGEYISIPMLSGPDGGPLKMRVCGVFRNQSSEDIYWVRSPSAFSQECLMPPSIFSELFCKNGGQMTLNANFYVMLDYTAMRADQAGAYLETAQAYAAYFDNIPGQSYEDAFSAQLSEFLVTAQKVDVTLWVLQVPIFMLLAAFIFMVSRQMLEMERSEIAVLKSRGASKWQIISTYLLQSAVLAVLSYLAGVPLGAILVQVLGSANAFLEFVQRSALPVEINGRVLLFSGSAALLSVAAMVLPVFRYADVSIVNHKQKKNRKSDTPLWQKLFLDVVVLAVALYALYSYSNQKDALAQRVLEGESLDPILFIGSSLFMVGAGLFALRILPAITYGIFRIFKKWWSPSLYAAFLRVIRTRHSQNFIVVFLILTIALGVFNAQAARTINTNEEENIRYSVGADVILKEKWTDNSAQVELDPTITLMYDEPDFNKYQDLDGVASITKVLSVRNASMLVKGGVIRDLQVMGIHTKSFGETVWMKDGLLPHHFYEYLNAMAMDPSAVLLSRNFATDYGYQLGDTVNYQNANGESTRGFVYGFVDYWPSYQPVTYSKGSDGLYKPTSQYLVIANLNQLQSDWGIEPYEIWIKTEGSTQFLYDFAREQGLTFEVFEDTSRQVVSLKNDPVFQGTNGILTVGFVVVLVLCSVGFLIYWILSIQSRALQFGIYRAMGMSMGEIITMLLCEQVFISGTAIATGAAVGLLTSKLYMPLIQMAYAQYDSVLPLRVVSLWEDIAQLLLVVGVVILVCMLILAWLISRMRIAQALKLGED